MRYHTLISITALAGVAVLASPAAAQGIPPPLDDSAWARTDTLIPMRDGIRLFTVILSPRNAGTPLPILILRTPYGAKDYVPYIGRMAKRAGLEGYIFVLQDIRGRFGSEGAFDMTRPLYVGHGSTDESTDTYDTIDWLVKNVPHNNGRVGVFGVSYDGAGRVAEALNVELGAKEERELAARPTASLEAYDAFLRGEAATRRFSTIDVSALRRGLIYYEQAVELDSSFALAWTRVSRARSLLYFVSSSDPADSAVADMASRRALALAPNLPDARLASGEYYDRVVQDNSRALEEYQRGRRLAPNDASLIAACSIPLQSLGRWEEAAADAREAVRLDPRSNRTGLRLARVLTFLRRYEEALAAADAALRLDPAAPDAVWMKAMAYAAKGDLQEIHSLYRSTPPQLDRAALVTYIAHFWEMAWTLEPRDLDLLSRLSPEPFGGQRSDWGLALAQAWALKGDTAHSRIYADSARVEFEQMASRTPRNDQNMGLLGLSLAYLGRYDEAIAAAKRSVALRGVDTDKYNGGYNQLQLARVYAMAGRRDQAIETLETLLKTPLFVTPGWLRIDPTFASLRGDPRFKRLATDTPR